MGLGLQGESPLIKSEKVMVLERARALEISSETKMQEVVRLIIMEGGTLCAGDECHLFPPTTAEGPGRPL
jgi:hypothetical protein